MPDDVLERIRALERAVTDRDDPPTPLPEHADLATAIDQLDDRLTSIESTLADVSARQTAVEAYLDRVEHVNESVERRADAALAAVDRLESADSRDGSGDTTPIKCGETADHSGPAEGGRLSDIGRVPQQAAAQDPSSRPATSGAHIADAAGLSADSDTLSGSGRNADSRNVADIDPESESRQSPGLFERMFGGLLGR